MIDYGVAAAHAHNMSINAIDEVKAKSSEAKLTEARKLIAECVEEFGSKK
ncbi:MAG: hypothetical protein L0Z68_02090 [Gammaproteobacteria bacterium]|nr:hypothetical protein [Gammaproteobacteria bacterium]